MKPWLVVAWKEIFESLRDRRTLLTSLIIAPLLGPVLFSGMMQFTLAKENKDHEQRVEAGVLGAGHAPQLLLWLQAQGLKRVPAPATESLVTAAVRNSQPKIVLVIPADYGEQLSAGKPASVKLYVDTSDSDAHRAGERLQRLLAGYAAQTAALRLMARGIDPSILQPVVTDEIDVSTPASRAQALLGVLSYFLLLSTLVGGMYLAIDATAGERERGSLEPLLALPVSRDALVAGKLLATMVFAAASLLLTLVTFIVALRFVPLESIGMSANLGPLVALKLWLSLLPFVPLAAALLTLIASFARSFREAQSWMTGVLLIPTLPIMLAVVAGLKPTSALMAIPSLSQHFLVSRLLRDEAIPLPEMLLSVGGTLTLAALLSALVVALWRHEKLLG